MARVNCDPYAGGHLFALVHHVTGLLDGDDQLKATVRALDQNGIPDDDIAIFTGDEGARCLDLFGREHSRTIRLLRTLETAVGGEGETNHRIDEALHRGASLVCVRIHKRKSDEKARAFRALQAGQAHEIHYWGTWGFEDVPSGDPSCALCTLPAGRILDENEHAVWVSDLHPVSPGHSLIVAKRHVASFFELPADERDGMLSLLDRARENVARDRSPAGYNVGINEGTAAGQTVPHLHIHLIPRFLGDSKNPRGGVRWVLPEKADFWTPR
jgi:diadenosine tetraphosphate (Ap4A) HIT family hydrolase